MSGIVLSASVRQNLLSLQSTADLLATTQSRLSTGKKVNTALDNPTNFFTAAGLDSRASDINNLLDGISNGVQILQAANTGISSLQKLIDTAKSVANQALQSNVGYSTKSNVSATIAGATADDLRGTMTFANASAASNVIYSGAPGGTTAVTGTSLIGGLAGALTGAATTNLRTPTMLGTAAGTALYSAAGTTAGPGTALSALTDSTGGAAGIGNGETLTFGGKTITFQTGSAALSGSGNAWTMGIGTTVNDLRLAIDQLSGTTTPSSLSGGVITVNTTAADLTFTGTALGGLHLPAAPITRTNSTPPTAISTNTKLFDVTTASSDALGTSSPVADGDTLTVNGKTITFRTADVPTGTAIPSGYGVSGYIATDGSGNSIVYLGTSTTTTAATVGDVETAIDLASGVKSATIAGGIATPATVPGQTPSSVLPNGALSLSTTTGGDLTLGGKADVLHAFGLTAATGGATTTLTAARSSGAGTTGSLIQAGSTLNVDGKTITFVDEAVPGAGSIAAGSGISGNIVTDGSGNSKVYLRSANINDVLNAIDLATGTKVASNVGGSASVTVAAGAVASSVSPSGTLNLSTGLTHDLAISGTGNALSALGLAGNTGSATTFSAPRGAGPGGINGTTMSFTAFKGGTPVNVTFGDGTNGTVKTLAQLNAALAPNNMTATVDSTGKLTITTGNDYASSTLGAADGGVIGGTVTSALAFTPATAPQADAVAQAARSNLVAQFNNIVNQINTTSQDASFNGINLLSGDTLKLVFNETGKSTLNVQGMVLSADGLGLPLLTSGTDLLDNASANKLLTQLNAASTQLRSDASSLGSNLSIVQIRQDFAKSLINVLQTGSSNLTLADTNEEAANSQALSTRQSIAVSALSLANQSQQSVLKLLQ